MKHPFPNFRVVFVLYLLLQMQAIAAPQIRVARHPNCNLFDASEAVKFDATLKDFASGAGSVKVTVTSYFGESKILDIPLPSMTEGRQTPVVLNLGVFAPGYYELKVEATVGGVMGESKMMSFGVVHFVNRTAEEARKDGYRFGLKTFSLGPPGLWWRKGEVWNLAEVVDACVLLGLQWTRHQFNQQPVPEPGVISTDDLIRKHRMNVVLKVEGFPEDCFDVGRYGSIENWKVQKKNKIWNRCTVPLKEPYQKWLKEEIAKIPSEQNIFEIGNEVWNYMPAEEFAEWAKMSVAAIKQARPDAKVGADPGQSEYGRKFLAAGGMDGMDIWYCHPYSFTPLPEHRIRGFLRNYREILKRRTGRDFELYVTEYGWPIAPNDSRKHSVSERVQAQRTTRESLMLYAENAKTLIPHWMGDREQDPAEREHWFGFFRLNQQPLPVVIAHANCARMIDSGKFVGDLWQGPGIGAMLFERAGIYTLAVWTAEQDRQAEIEVGAPEVKMVDMLGGERKLQATLGKVLLKLNGDVTYLVGVSPELARKVTTADADLNPDLWSKREESFKVDRAVTAPRIDGDLGDWAETTPVLLKEVKAGASGSGTYALRWDNDCLYAAFTVKGHKSGSREKLDFGLGVRPDRQADMGSTTIFDFDFKLKHLGEGKDSLNVENADFDKVMEIAPANDPSGIRWAVKASTDGWTAEVAIPITFLRGISTPAAGLKLSGAVAVKNAEDNKPLLSRGAEKAREWPYLVLQK